MIGSNQGSKKKNIIKMNPKESSSGTGPLAVSCAQGNVIFGSVNVGEFVRRLFTQLSS
jgi:hypothetical protein